jgi:L,D-peptidoglycan transpeptidase YkuD (ErfK/YbiS/YcfS/YnhG family)
MNSRRTAAALAAALCLAMPLPAKAKEQPACPDIADAERLILVLGDGLTVSAATLRLYRRQDDTWQATGEPKAASLGADGMAWSWAARAYATQGEPVKVEGDGRSPAGFFRVGKAFGFSPRAVSSYTQLRPGEHYCVDDAASPHYNRIVQKAAAGGSSGEDMGEIPLYRQGLFVTYPTSREARGGSCIFLHVWRKKNAGTAGCVALAEADVTALQDWSQPGQTVIGILPKAAWERLRACFPGL